MSIRENLGRVEERIAAACKRAGRARDEVTLVAVSKTMPAEAISEAIAAGVRNIGENRVQETRDKKPHVRGDARWHLIGHLQSNKVNQAVQLFNVVQTIDSLGLAQKIEKAAESPIEMLIEVNIGSEPQKAGVLPKDVEALAKQVKVSGLMTIPPIGAPEESRKYFRELRLLRDKLGLKELSMGMSEDFEVAIEEGATIVRVGRAIFGERS